jgi:excisionase family DNA binding protein
LRYLECVGGNMEKICIAKRRKKNIYPEQYTINDITDNNAHKISFFARTNNQPEPIFKQINKYNERLFSFNLTSEEYTVMKDIYSIKKLLDENIYGVELETRKEDAGRILFNFVFKPMSMIKMLDYKSVCEILLISNSFLNKLVKTGEIRSYKIGRNRRFLFEDILEYLSKNQET